MDGKRWRAVERGKAGQRAACTHFVKPRGGHQKVDETHDGSVGVGCVIADPRVEGDGKQHAVGSYVELRKRTATDEASTARWLTAGHGKVSRHEGRYGGRHEWGRHEGL